MSNRGGKLTCRKLTKAQATKILASAKYVWPEVAKRELEVALDGEDAIELSGDRYIYTKRGLSDLKLCTDTRSSTPSRRSSGRGKRAAKTFFGSKAGWTVVGAVAGFVLAKVF